MDTTKEMTPQELRKYAIKWLEDENSFIPGALREMAEMDDLGHYAETALDHEANYWAVGMLVCGLMTGFDNCIAIGMAYLLLGGRLSDDQAAYAIEKMEAWSQHRAGVSANLEVA